MTKSFRRRSRTVLPFAALCLGTTLLLTLMTPAAAAEALSYRVTVDAGPVARVQSPVTAVLEVGKEITAEEVAALKEPIRATLAQSNADGAGSPIVAQANVKRGGDGRAAALVVAWVVADLPAGKSAAYDLTLAAANEKADPVPVPGFRFKPGDGFRDLLYADAPVYRHMTAYDPKRREETYKPFHHVYGFGGKGDDEAGFITKGPGGQYTHHRGLYVGWNKTTAGGKTYDFWHCPAEHQQHVMYQGEQEMTGPVYARALAVTDWLGGDERSVVRDRRDVTAWHLGDGASLLDFTITLGATGDAVRLDGDPQHAGFQFRAAEEVQQGKTTYVRPEGAKGTGNDVWENCPWVAGLFKVAGRSYAVVHMDHPDNPRPAVYSTRDYGRFGPFFTHDLKPEAPLAVRYRVLVLDAEKHADASTAAAFAARYDDYAKPVRVTVKP